MHLNESYQHSDKDRARAEAPALSIADTLLGFGSTASADIEMAECAACGYTRETYQRTGQLGCPECYITFSEGLDELLKNLHGSSSHVGKVPACRVRQSTTRTENLL